MRVLVTGSSGYIGGRLVPRLIAALAASHSGLSLTYLEAEPPEAVEAVREDVVAEMCHGQEHIVRAALAHLGILP